ncbi:hypothetical protein LCGC14_3022340 [marine sediment metagenome]|uniref:Uncharacterized protein n=1 Tax=marine sediment metagenome TaxID=412755 RepID=A0A0F8Z2G7_9ZZZZ
MTPKKKAWKQCSRYCRLRDALAYCKEHGINLHQFSRPEDIIGACATCGAVKSWYLMDAGHFISRGAGGVSGVYFDERNVNLQCKRCNAFEQGAYQGYRNYIIHKYSIEVLDELLQKHYILPDMKDLAMVATEEYYKEKYQELVDLTK